MAIDKISISYGTKVILGNNLNNNNAKENLKKFINAAHDVESNKGKNLYNESSATGHFQFKTLINDYFTN